MNKPYIIITLNNNQIEKVIYYGENNRDKELSKTEVYHFIMQNHINIHYLDNSRIITNDPRIIQRYKPAKITQAKYAKKVSRKNKYIYKSFIASAVVIATLISSSILITNIKGSETEPENEEKIAYEQIINEERTPNIVAAQEITNLEVENNNYINIDYEYRTGNEIHQYAIENYAHIAEKIAPIYGLDKNLILAIITQENARNRTDCYAQGVMCIEPVWFDEQISAYNHNTKTIETITIKKDLLINPEYAIKIGCMILANEYKMICTKFPELDEQTKILASIVAYNKGSGTINKLLSSYSNDFANHIDETKGGDNLYYQHVLSYLEDGEDISFTTPDEKTSYVKIDNLNCSNFKR